MIAQAVFKWLQILVLDIKIIWINWHSIFLLIKLEKIALPHYTN